MLRTATCCCEQATIKVEGDPKLHAVCHCSNCKKRTGSAFGVSAYFMDTQVISKGGDTEIYEINNEETQQKRYFCKHCGSTLYWKITKFDAIPGIEVMTGIAGGSFEEDSLPEPTMSASNKQKCTWVDLPKLQVVS
ncbi:hypothetical protein MNBD_GAMMA10-2958 [hydrothermal vent metagenome]|uniref:CENP-V/GFA domain-containing protein n=1 Tax=hydrothermal vent metagenome TaxID=652676 RepID=A0A3B0YAN5_9ZZZZ